MHAPIAKVLLVAAVAVVFAAFCVTDLVRGAPPRHLPRWAWVLIICVWIPWGGLGYLFFGRAGRPGASPETLAPVPAAMAAAPPTIVPPTIVPPTTRAPASIELDGLTKRYGRVIALDGLSVTIRPGAVTGFLGPNGAGKTTTMRLILGLDIPSAGTALVGGHRYQEIFRPLHEVGSLLDATAVDRGRTAWFHLLALARSNGISQRRVREVLELTGLETVANRRAGEFSLGMKQRLGIAAALLGDPGVLMLDEPVNGLDAEGVRWIRQLLASLAAEGRTVLVSSHLMSEMAMIADHLIIIGRGRLLADTPAADFVAGARRDVLVKSPGASELATLLMARGATVRPDGDGVAVAGLDAPDIGDLALAHGIAIHELVPRHASLEDAYLDLTSDSTDYHAKALPAGKATVP